MTSTPGKTDFLGTDRLTRLAAKFTLPAVIGMLVTALYNIVDRIYVGNIPQVGGLAFASIHITFPLITLIIAFGGLIRMGSTSLFSISLGEGNREQADKLLNMAFMLFVILGIAYMGIILAFLTPILTFLGASEQTLPYARDYMAVIALGAPFQFVAFGMTTFIQADGSPKVAMFSQIIGGVLNIILDPIFIYGFGMTTKGVAIATVISQVVSAAFVVGYFFTRRSSFALQLRKMRLKLELLWRVVRLGFPMFLNQIAMAVVLALMNKQIKNFGGGDMHLAAIGIVMSITQFTTLPVIGVAHGIQPIVGYNYGAKKYARVIKTYWIGVVAGTSFILLLYTFFMIWPNLFINLFVGSSQLDMGFTAKAIRTILLLEPLIGFEIITANFYMSTNQPLKSLMLNLLRTVFAMIPLLLILPNFFGLDGVLYVGPISELIAVIATVLCITGDLKRLGRPIAVQ